MSPAVVAAVVAVIVASPLLHALLPPKYFYDSGYIQLLAQGLDPFPAGQSFRNTAAVYGFLGLSNEPLLAFIAGLAALVILLLVPRIRHAKVHGFGGLAVVTLIALSGGAYLTQYSKDVFVLPVSLVAAMVPATRRGELALLVAIGAYAAVFRSYWILIGAIYLALRFVLSRTSRPFTFVISIGLLLLALSLLFPLVLHQPLDHYRSLLIVGRDTAVDSNTLITPFINTTNPVAETANTILILASLLIPVPLLALRTPFYLGIALLLASFWVWAWRRAWIIMRTPERARDRFAVRAASLLFAVVTVQSVFEPDYGSYLKHLSPVLPLAVLLFRTASPKVVESHSEAA